MKKQLKLLAMLLGSALFLLGAYLTWTSLYSGIIEFQEFIVADYATGSTLEVSAHYPIRILAGRPVTVRLKFPTSEEAAGSALDAELNWPDVVVLPQKRLITPLNGEKGQVTWEVTAFTPGKVTANIGMALNGAPDGLFALTPSASAELPLTVYRVMGLSYPNALRAGVFFLLLGVGGLCAGWLLAKKQPRSKKNTRIYG